MNLFNIISIVAFSMNTKLNDKVAIAILSFEYKTTFHEVDNACTCLESIEKFVSLSVHSCTINLNNTLNDK